MTHLDLDAIRRDARDGLPVLPIMVLALCDWLDERGESDLADLRRLQGAYDSYGANTLYYFKPPVPTSSPSIPATASSLPSRRYGRLWRDYDGFS